MKRSALLFFLISLWSPDPTGASIRATGELDLMLLLDTASFSSEPSRMFLDAFLADLEGAHRVGIIAFGKEPALVFQIGPAASLDSRDFSKKHLGQKKPQPACKDLNGAVQLALDHFTKHSREHALKGMVILANGPFCPAEQEGGDPGEPGEGATGPVDSELLVNLRYNKILAYPIGLGGAGEAALKQVAVQTDGKYLTAGADDNLFDVLSTVYGNLENLAAQAGTAPGDPKGDAKVQEKLDAIKYELSKGEKQAAEERKLLSERIRQLAQKPVSNGVDPVSVVFGVSMLGMLVLIAILVIRLSQRAGPGIDPGNRPSVAPGGSASFADLKLSASKILKELSKAEKGFSELNLDLEEFGIEVWENEQKLKRDYASVMNGLFLLLDHLAVQSGGGGAKQDSAWLIQKIEQILSDEKVEDIEVKPGEKFDSKVHNNAGDRAGDLPAGAILEVVRRGYRLDRGAENGNEEILRPADVIVSRGPSGGPAKSE